MSDRTAATSVTPSRARRGLPWLGALALVALGVDAVYRAGLGPKERTDLPVYLAASERLLEGKDPVGATSARGWPYYYPPTLAVLLVPLVPAPLPLAAGVWFAVGAAALVGGAHAARRAVDGAAWDRWDALAAALVALPAASALLRGQMGPPLLGLCAGAALLLARGRDAPAGALLALATALKVTPGALLLALPLARRGRAAAAAGGGLVVCLLLLPAPVLGLGGAARACAGAAQVVLGLAAAPGHVDVPGDAPQARDPHIPTNQSLASQAIRRLPEGGGRAAVVLLLGAAALAPGLVHAARGRLTRALALLLAAPLVAAPVAWHHHHVVLLPALLLLAHTARAGDRPARAALAAFAALSLLHFAVTPLRPYGLLGWGTLGVFVALAAAAPGAAEDERRVTRG
ncbi:MAG: glycosyltransferase 87 family protein [Planctomycetes bacterium]|nr:glycosyltransferase 87 family protein [Planctomycetota bacterium]